MTRILIAASAVLLLGSAAWADETGTAPAAAPPPQQKVQCHHDGEVIQTPTGDVVCHMKKPVAGVHNMSREWFRDQQNRSSTMNH